MAKKPPRKPPPKPPAKKPPARKKETISSPSPALLSREAKKLRRGDSAAGRIMAEQAVAVREGVAGSKAKGGPRPKPPKPMGPPTGPKKKK